MPRPGWRTMFRRLPPAIRAGLHAGQRTRSSAGRSAEPVSGGCSGADLTPQVLRDALQILNEGTHLERTRLVIGRTQDRRGMHGRHHGRQTWPLDELAALEGHPEVTAEKRLGGG